MKEILRSHAAAYPLIEPCDAVKLIYQSVFGGGHMIPSEDLAVERLIAEHGSVSHNGEPWRTESLGEISRVYLDADYTDDELRLLAKIFCASAKFRHTGYAGADEASKRRFDKSIDCLRELCAEGLFEFDINSLNEYLAQYYKNGCPAVSHSEAYRKAYAPAYRVIDSRYVRLIESLRSIGELLRSGNTPLVVAIDGRCASGKTTSAQLIAEIFPAEIIHLDDFFLPPELRTPERLAEIGGNFHRERFMAEVVGSLRNPDGFSYRVFSCSVFDYLPEPRRIEPAPLIICEGSYSLHPKLGKYYDIALFSTVSHDEQLRRILLRNGEFMLTRFKNEWIPMEERYFDHFGIQDRCLILKDNE